MYHIAQTPAGEPPSWTIDELVSIDFDVEPEVLGETLIAVLSKHADLRELVAKRWTEDHELRDQLEESWEQSEASLQTPGPEGGHPPVDAR